MSLQLNSVNGSVTLVPEDGAGNVNVTVPRGGIGKVLQVVSFDVPSLGVSVPAYANNKANFRQLGTQSWTITKVNPLSKLFLCFDIVMGSAVGPHIYLDIQQNGAWIPSSGTDGVVATHYAVTNKYNVAISRLIPSIGVSTVTLTPYVGSWGAAVVEINQYNAGNFNQNSISQAVIMEVL